MTASEIEALGGYYGATPKPADFEAFWQARMAEADAVSLDYTVTQAKEVPSWDGCDFLDLWFTGMAGARIYAKYLRPHSDKPVPLVLQFHGYPGASRSFAEQGASWVHVVDLSAAFGEDEDACAANLAAIKAICGVDGLSADVGGGVRSLARIDELAGYGARRIALGTVLVTEPGFAEVAAQGFGELLVADIAARDGQVKVNGWRDGACVALDDAVAQLTELGFKHLVYTDIARDGMQTGIDVAAYRHVAEVAGFPVVASGGISTLDDIRALAAVGEDAIEGAITGRALYEGNFTLAQALAAARGKE